jgi:hypothetical protein
VVPSPTPMARARDLKYTVHAFTRMGRGVQQAARLRMRDDATGSSQWRRRCNECGDLGVRSYGPASCEVSPTNTRANVGWPQQQVAGSVFVYPAERMHESKCAMSTSASTTQLRPPNGPGMRRGRQRGMDFSSSGVPSPEMPAEGADESHA